MIYDVEVTRDEDAWMVSVPALNRVTQALRIEDVDVMARDLISLMTGQTADGIEIAVHMEE